MFPFERKITDRFLGEARKQVGEDMWSNAWKEGHAMALARGVELALQGEPRVEEQTD